MKGIFKTLLAFMLQNRRSGTTTLLRLIADTHDVYVVVPFEADKKEFGDSAITFQDLEDMKGKTTKPILIDNHSMLKLCAEHNLEVNELSENLKERDEVLDKIRDAIAGIQGQRFFTSKENRGGLTKVHQSGNDLSKNTRF